MQQTSVLSRFVAEATRQGMMTNEFVFLAAKLVFTTDGYEYPWTYGAGDRSDYTQEEWEERKSPYKHLKIVSL